MQIDLTPVLDTSVSLAALALGTLGSLALARLTRTLGIRADAEAMATYDSALDKALRFGLSQLTQLIARRGWDHPEVRNATLAIALPVLVGRFPDALRAVGLDPADSGDALRARLTAALERAFPDAVARAAASPATPDAGLTAATVPAQPAEAGEDASAGATLHDTLATLVASHETTNALLTTLVAQQTSAPATPTTEPPAAVTPSPVLAPLPAV